VWEDRKFGKMGKEVERKSYMGGGICWQRQKKTEMRE